MSEGPIQDPLELPGRQELIPEELWETSILFAPYPGCPDTAGLVVPGEEVTGTWIADGSPDWSDQDRFE